MPALAAYCSGLMQDAAQAEEGEEQGGKMHLKRRRRRKKKPERTGDGTDFMQVGDKPSTGLQALQDAALGPGPQAADPTNAPAAVAAYPKLEGCPHALPMGWLYRDARPGSNQATQLGAYNRAYTELPALHGSKVNKQFGTSQGVNPGELPVHTGVEDAAKRAAAAFAMCGPVESTRVYTDDTPGRAMFAQGLPGQGFVPGQPGSLHSQGPPSDHPPQQHPADVSEQIAVGYPLKKRRSRKPAKPTLPEISERIHVPQLEAAEQESGHWG